MSNEIFTIIVLIIAVILYALDKIPLAVTALLSMLALYFKGIMSFSDAFSGFAHNAVMMQIGMQIFGLALYETGVVDLIAKALMEGKLFGKNGLTEKKFLVIGGLLAAALCVVLSPVLIVLMFYSVIDAMSLRSNGKITRKNTYLPITIASNCGGMFTPISTVTVILTSGFLASSSVGRDLNFFEPMVVGVPALLVYVIFFATIGPKMMKKCFNFDEIPPVENASGKSAEEKASVPRWKLYLTIGILVATVVVIIVFKNKFQMGAVCLAGAVLTILTGCIDGKKAFGGLKMQPVFLVAASIGFAKGVDVSGAGLMIANFILSIFGNLARQPFFLCFIALLTSALLSNLMNNASATALLVPIFIATAEQAGINIVPIAIAAGLGANLAFATPVAGPVFAMAGAAGYRFKDYVRVGGAVNILCVIVCSIVLYFAYFVF